MTPQELKTSILWNAIQGNLSQHFEDEIAEPRLLNLNLTPVPASELYFDIPKNWVWCKIKDIFKFVNGKAFKPSDWGTDGLPIVRIQNLNDVNAPYNYYNGEIEDKYVLYGGELLFSWSGTPGTSFGAFIWTGGKAVLNQHIFIAYPKFQMNYQYAKYDLNGEIKIFIEKAHGGAGLKHITKAELENCILPIPPLTEQKRIVAKIEELLPLVDRYEQAWTKLEDFNRCFPEDMKKSILQQATQGKLVEQRPEEGTAQELYAQIQAEKQRLIKEGKFKKEKPLPEITEDEKPFEIPEGWMWVRFSNLMNEISTGPFGSMLHKSDYVKNGIPLVNPANIVQGKIVPSEKMMISKDTAERLKSYILHTGMIVIGRRGEMGRCAIIGEDENGWVCGTGSFFLTPSSVLFVQYIQTLFSTQYAKKYLGGESVGTTMSNLNHNILKKMPVPLPPLAEQERIVAQLEELLPLCERLK